MGCWEGLTRDEVARALSRPVRRLDGRAGRSGAAAVRNPADGGRAGRSPRSPTCRPAAVAVVVTHGGTAGRLMERLLGLGSDHRRVFGPAGQLRLERAGGPGRAAGG